MKTITVGERARLEDEFEAVRAPGLSICDAAKAFGAATLALEWLLQATEPHNQAALGRDDRRQRAEWLSSAAKKWCDAREGLSFALEQHADAITRIDHRGGEPMDAYDSTQDTMDHIELVNHLLSSFALRLMRRGLAHDSSKLEEPEKAIFDEYTPRLREVEYGSAEYKECLDGMKAALDHHYASNRHHPEFHPHGTRDMTLLDLVEMLCDWKAAGERHADGGDIVRSIELNQARFGYGDELKAILLATAHELWEERPCSSSGSSST